MRIHKFAVLVVGFAGLTLAGQDWYHDRDTRVRGEGWRPQIFMSVKEDLDHIYSAGAAKDKERHRLERTKEELVALQSKLDQGVFDNGTLNDVIDSLRKSANDDRLAPRDRDVIHDDVDRLHDYQRNHNNWKHR